MPNTLRIRAEVSLVHLPLKVRLIFLTNGKCMLPFSLPRTLLTMVNDYEIKHREQCSASLGFGGVPKMGTNMYIYSDEIGGGCMQETKRRINLANILINGHLKRKAAFVNDHKRERKGTKNGCPPSICDRPLDVIVHVSELEPG